MGTGEWERDRNCVIVHCVHIFVSMYLCTCNDTYKMHRPASVSPCPSLRSPVCLSVCLPACLPACLPVCRSVCLSTLFGDKKVRGSEGERRTERKYWGGWVFNDNYIIRQTSQISHVNVIQGRQVKIYIPHFTPRWELLLLILSSTEQDKNR